MDRFALLKKDSYDAALLREQKKLQYQDEVDWIAVEVSSVRANAGSAWGGL